MPTVKFKDSLKAMADRKPELANQLIEDALNALLSGELDEGRVLLRNYIHATIGFPELARRTGKNDKNLMRSLSSRSNPTAANLFEIIQACTKAEGVTLAAYVIPKPANNSAPEPG